MGSLLPPCPAGTPGLARRRSVGATTPRGRRELALGAQPVVHVVAAALGLEDRVGAGGDVLVADRPPARRRAALGLVGGGARTGACRGHGCVDPPRGRRRVSPSRPALLLEPPRAAGT